VSNSTSVPLWEKSPPGRGLILCEGSALQVMADAETPSRVLFRMMKDFSCRCIAPSCLSRSLCSPSAVGASRGCLFRRRSLDFFASFCFLLRCSRLGCPFDPQFSFPRVFNLFPFFYINPPFLFFLCPSPFRVVVDLCAKKNHLDSESLDHSPAPVLFHSMTQK